MKAPVRKRKLYFCSFKNNHKNPPQNTIIIGMPMKIIEKFSKQTNAILDFSIDTYPKGLFTATYKITQNTQEKPPLVICQTFTGKTKKEAKKGCADKTFVTMIQNNWLEDKNEKFDWFEKDVDGHREYLVKNEKIRLD